MDRNKEITEMKDRKAILSTLWICVTFSYLYTDLAMTIFSTAYSKAAARMSEGLVLGFAALMEIPIAMILLSRVLKYKANRWANIIAGVESTVFLAGSMLGGRLPAFYIFTATIELVCTLFIVWYAWKWPNPEGRPSVALDQG